MPEIEIRSARSDDVESLIAFEHSYYSEYVWQMSLDFSSEDLEAKFRRVRLPRRIFVPYPRKKEVIFKDIANSEAFLVAQLGGRPVGYIKVKGEVESSVASVTDLVVSASMRRQGIASGLLLAAMNLVTHRHYQTLLLEIQSKNYPAIEMAQKLGFTFCGFRDNYFPNQEPALFFGRFVR